MLKTRLCEYREHMNLYRVPRPSSCRYRLCAGYRVHFLHVSSCLLAPPVLLFSSIAISIRSYITPLKPNPLFHSFSVFLSPLGPSHITPLKPNPPVLPFSSIAFSIRSLPYYSVKTKSSLQLFP